MVKILLILALALIAYFALRVRRPRVRNRTDVRAAPAEQGEAVVACSRCGVHVPASESIVRGGRHYCSEEHGRLG